MVAKKNTIKLNENALRQIITESVKKVLKEADEEGAYNLYKELCQMVGVKNIDDIEIKPKFQLGKTYLVFDDELSEENINLKRFAKDFIRENGLNSDYIFDIKGFSDEHKLWIEVFRKDF